MITTPDRQPATPHVLDQGLHEGFLRSALLEPGRVALELDGDRWTYGELQARAAAIAATIQRHTPAGGSPLTGVLAYRSPAGFAGTLAALLAGHGYVPLNPRFPDERSRWMLETADCRSLVADRRSDAQIASLLDAIAHPLLVVLPEHDDVRTFRHRWPAHTFIGARELELARAWTPRAPKADAIAYLLFTSGSTGTPKGVMVTHANATHFVATVAERYDIAADDRFSQMFDATFDLSVFDLFVAWSRGACVCCPSEAAHLNPDKFIRDARLTVWFSVPSVAVFMKRFGVLKKDRYPTLRLSLFCGEPLPIDIAEAWAAAAPRSILENLYGPTEVTVACTAYRWHRGSSVPYSAQGIVPIGVPLPGMRALVVDEAMSEVAPGEVGELLMSGPQVTPGYWRNQDETVRRYVRPAECDAVFYRTGDRVRKPTAGGSLTFVGRMDDQVKILGHRVELGEVEARLREAPGVEAAAAVAWPVSQTGAHGIAAFVTGGSVDPEAVRASLRETLPPYAMPRAIQRLAALPRNANGKADRQALLAMLRDASARA